MDPLRNSFPTDEEIAADTKWGVWVATKLIKTVVELDEDGIRSQEGIAVLKSWLDEGKI